MSHDPYFHIFNDCGELVRNSLSLLGPKRYRKIEISPVTRTGFTLMSMRGREIARDLCTECSERAIAADEIDDFNSVWFGCGT